MNEVRACFALITMCKHINQGLKNDSKINNEVVDELCVPVARFFHPGVIALGNELCRFFIKFKNRALNLIRIKDLYSLVVYSVHKLENAIVSRV